MHALTGAKPVQAVPERTARAVHRQVWPACTTTAPLGDQDRRRKGATPVSRHQQPGTPDWQRPRLIIVLRKGHEQRAIGENGRNLRLVRVLTRSQMNRIGKTPSAIRRARNHDRVADAAICAHRTRSDNVEIPMRRIADDLRIVEPRSEPVRRSGPCNSPVFGAIHPHVGAVAGNPRRLRERDEERASVRQHRAPRVAAHPKSQVGAAPARTTIERRKQNAVEIRVGPDCLDNQSRDK